MRSKDLDKAKSILFVYDADSGYFSGLADALRKLVAPESYSCNLCKVTYGTFGMRSEWRRFIESLHIPAVFLHRNEYLDRKAGPNLTLPVILLQDRNGDSIVLAEAAEINTARSIVDLKALVSRALRNAALRTTKK